MKLSKGYRDLIVYQKAFALAMKVFRITKKYPMRKSIHWLIKSKDHQDRYALALLKLIAKESIPLTSPINVLMQMEKTVKQLCGWSFLLLVNIFLKHNSINWKTKPKKSVECLTQ